MPAAPVGAVPADAAPAHAEQVVAAQVFDSLFKIGEAMENLSHTAEEKKKFDSVTHRIIAAFQERYPE